MTSTGSQLPRRTAARRMRRSSAAWRGAVGSTMGARNRLVRSAAASVMASAVALAASPPARATSAEVPAHSAAAPPPTTSAVPASAPSQDPFFIDEESSWMPAPATPAPDSTPTPGASTSPVRRPAARAMCLKPCETARHAVSLSPLSGGSSISRARGSLKTRSATAAAPPPLEEGDAGLAGPSGPPASSPGPSAAARSRSLEPPGLPPPRSFDTDLPQSPLLSPQPPLPAGSTRAPAPSQSKGPGHPPTPAASRASPRAEQTTRPPIECVMTTQSARLRPRDSKSAASASSTALAVGSKSWVHRYATIRACLPPWNSSGSAPNTVPTRGVPLAGPSAWQ
mmetsp:Transcript_25821/g.97262  ORF Transcript_25821/g.97262 Transcript_25821/m.97262 type:complete len:340 (-) Transcript_25821:260-1279(-)